MFEHLLKPVSSEVSSVDSSLLLSYTPSLSTSCSIPYSSNSSRRSSLSSSGPEFRPVHSDIIFPNLRTDFLEATSLPVNVPLHRDREASRPSTPMREEFYRCNKQLPYSLASKLLSTPSYKFLEFLGREGDKKEREGRIDKEALMKDERKEVNCDICDLMFNIEL